MTRLDPISARVNQPGAHTAYAEDGEPASYRVAVHYQTASGGNTRYVTVDATSWDEALTRAGDRVRERRGVLEVDRGASLVERPVKPVTPPTLVEAAGALLDWAREHTSPRDPNSPHTLLVALAKALGR